MQVMKIFKFKRFIYLLFGTITASSNKLFWFANTISSILIATRKEDPFISFIMLFIVGAIMGWLFGLWSVKRENSR